MTAKILKINEACRFPKQSNFDAITFGEGVNLIVGEMNTGKTKWLQMIDFVLGDPGRAEDAFTKELAEAYERITLNVVIGEEELLIERRWKETGAARKIFVNNEKFTAKEFSEFILNKLEIPLIQVPSGNPYSDRSWPELSWRELFRHMYKQERFWSDVVQKQPEIVRSACILHFLGVAKSLYSGEYNQHVAKQKEKIKLEAQKEVFVEIFQKLATDMLGQSGVSVAVTPDTLDSTRNRLSGRLAEIDIERKNILNTIDDQRSTVNPMYDTARERLELLHQQLGDLENELKQNKRRYVELKGYSQMLESELKRYARAKAGAFALSDLKVTHCPSCDQVIPAQLHKPDCCQVCGQRENYSVNDVAAGKRRFEFEELQVSDEYNEMTKMIEQLEKDSIVLNASIVEVQRAIKEEGSAISSATTFAIRALPPELSLLDREAGQIGAELTQIERVERAMASREAMNNKIATLDQEIANLDAEIKRMTPNVNFQELGDLISDRMNDYLNIVNADRLSRWKTGRVSVRLRKENFEIFLDSQLWSIKAGGTANYIVQLAYQYALFSLTKDHLYNYPGFILIDFPPHFASSDDLRDSESYLLEPFVRLCALNEMKGAQAIIAGRAFDNLKNANMIRF